MKNVETAQGITVVECLTKVLFSFDQLSLALVGFLKASYGAKGVQ